MATRDDIPTFSFALENTSEEEVDQIDVIFDDPSFFDAVTGLLLICGGFEGANEDYLNEVYNEICEVTQQDPTEYADTIDLDNYDIQGVLEKMTQLPLVMKSTVAVIIGHLCEDAVDNEEGDLQWIIDQLTEMID